MILKYNSIICSRELCLQIAHLDHCCTIAIYFLILVYFSSLQALHMSCVFDDVPIFEKAQITAYIPLTASQIFSNVKDHLISIIHIYCVLNCSICCDHPSSHLSPPPVFSCYNTIQISNLMITSVDPTALTLPNWQFPNCIRVMVFALIFCSKQFSNPF